jgi:kynurenine formamidase
MASLIDLSHPIENGMTTYPGLPGPMVGAFLTRESSRDHYDAGTEFHIGQIDMVGNTGTYLDTPFHRFPDGFDLADLDLASVAGVPGVCLRVDVQEITADLVDGPDLSGRALLLATGWDRHWRTEMYGDASHPFLSAEAAEALVAGGVTLVGIDSVNIDDTRGGTRPAHTTLLRAGVPVVEHLTGLDDLFGRTFRFYAVPAPIRGLGTFPVRAFAELE